MTKILGLLFLAAFPLFSQAADIQVNVGTPRIQSGNTNYTYGSRDKRGYYWDGNQWRDPDYWDKNKGKGNSNAPGQNCPPGQAKKGKC